VKAVLHQPYYLPYPGFFHKITLGDVFVIMDDVQYDERFTNRNRIISTHGYTWINVPINKEDRFRSNIEVRINNDLPWKEKQWSKISHSYEKSKFFHLYSKYFESLFKKEWDYLFDLDFETITQIFKWLNINIEIIKESELCVTSKSTQRIVDVCKKIGADTYVSGIGGRNYMDEKLFEKYNLKLEYQNYTHPKYPQHWSNEFIPDLSIIDMLSNVGPDTIKVLKGQITFD